MSVIDLGPAYSEAGWEAIGQDVNIINIEEVPEPGYRADVERARVNLGANRGDFCIGYRDWGQEEGLTLGDIAIALVTPK